jgi:oligopeptide transport system permease protein
MAMADETTPAVGAESGSPAARAWRRFRANRPALGAAVVLIGAVVWITLGPWLVGQDPHRLTEDQLQAPSTAHWLGTDANGRDVRARVEAGARVSLFVGLAGAAVSLVIGVAWGAVAGYAGGRTDAWMMRCVDILYSLPSIIFVIVLVATLQDTVRGGLDRWVGPAGAQLAGLLFLVVGLGAVSWLTMARIVRGQVLSLRQRPFVEAARVLGAGPLRILGRHILPNIAGIVIVYLTLTVPAVVLGESFLSYLGLGIQPPQASLGSLLADGAGQINPVRTAWWLLAGPGGMLVLLLLALGYFGDGLRDAFDPRSVEDQGG